VTVPFGLDPFTLYTLGRRLLGGRSAESDLIQPPQAPGGVPLGPHAVTPQEEGGPPEPNRQLQTLIDTDPATAGIIQGMRDKLQGVDTAPPAPQPRVPRAASELRHPVVRPEQVRPAPVAPPGGLPVVAPPETIPGQPAPTPVETPGVSALTPERLALEREAKVLRLGIPPQYGGRLPEGIIRGASDFLRIPARAIAKVSPFDTGLEAALNRQERTEQQLQETESPSALGTVGKFVGSAGASAPLFEGAGELVQPYSELLAKGLSRIPAPIAPELQGVRLARPLLGPKVIGATAGLAHATATFMTGSAATAALDAASRGASAPEVAHAAWEGAVTGVDPTDPMVAAQLALSAYTGLAHAQARATNSAVAARIAEALDLGPEDPLAPAPRTAEVGTAAGAPTPGRQSVVRSAEVTRRINAIRMARGAPLPGTEAPLEEPAFTRGQQGVSVREMQARAGLPAPRPVRPIPEQAAAPGENLEVPTYLRRAEEQYGPKRPAVLPEQGQVAPIGRRAGEVQPSVPLPERRRLPGVSDIAPIAKLGAAALGQAQPPRRGVAEEQPLDYLEAPYKPLQGKWYSRLERAVESSPFPRGTTQQWQALLSQGVPKGEVEYRGVGQWLAQQEPNRVIPREEVQAHIGPMPVGELRGGRRGPEPGAVEENATHLAAFTDQAERFRAALTTLADDGKIHGIGGEPVTTGQLNDIKDRLVQGLLGDSWWAEEQHTRGQFEGGRPESNAAHYVVGKRDAWTPELQDLIHTYIDRMRPLATRMRELGSQLRGGQAYGAEESNKYSEYSHGVESREGVYSPGGNAPEIALSSRVRYPYELVRVGGAIEPERLAEVPFTARRNMLQAKFTATRDLGMRHVQEVIDELQRRRNTLNDQAYEETRTARDHAENTGVYDDAYYAKIDHANGLYRQEAALQKHQKRFEALIERLYDTSNPQGLAEAITAVQEDLTPRRLGNKRYGLQEQVRTLQRVLGETHQSLAPLLEEQRQLPPRPTNLPRPTTIGHFGNIDEEAHRRTEILPMERGGQALHITELQSDRMQKMRGALPEPRRQELMGQLAGISADPTLDTKQRAILSDMHQNLVHDGFYPTAQMPHSFGAVDWSVDVSAGGRTLVDRVMPASLAETVGRELATRAMKAAGVTPPGEELARFFEYYHFPEPIEAKLKEILPVLQAHTTAGTRWAMIPRTRTPDWVGLQMRGAIQDALAKGLHDLTWSTSADLRLRYRKALATALRDKQADSIEFTFHSRNAPDKTVTIPASDFESAGGQGYVTEYDEMMPRIVKEIGKEVGVPLTVDKITLTPHGVPIKAWHVHIPDNFGEAIDRKGGLRLWEPTKAYRMVGEPHLAFPEGKEPIVPAETRRLLMKGGREQLSLRGVQLPTDHAQAAQTLATALAPWRDPKIEHLHIILTRKGEIVAHNHSTVGANVFAASNDIERPPKRKDFISTHAFHQAMQEYMAGDQARHNRWLTQLLDQARRTGADEVHMAHNHPSGQIVPSVEDIHYAGEVAKELEARGGGRLRLASAIVINHGTASEIDIPKAKTLDIPSVMQRSYTGENPLQQGLARQFDVPTTGPDWTDAHRMAILNPDDLPKLATFLRDASVVKPGMFGVVFMDSQRRTVGLSNHRMSSLATIGTWLPQELRGMGADSVILATHGEDMHVLTSVLKAQKGRPAGTSWESLHGAAMPIWDIVDINTGHTPGIPFYRGAGEPIETHRVRPPLREEVPAPYTPGQVTNLDKIESDPEGRKALEEQVQQVVAHYGKDALRKLVVPHAQTIAEAKAAGIDLRGLDGDIVPSEARAHVLGAGQVIAANTARMVDVAKMVDDQSLPADQRERAQRALQLLAQQNDHLLYGLIRSKSEGGRLLNSFKILARATLDPGLWLQRAAQVAQRPLTIDEQTEIGRLLQMRDREGVVRYVAKLHQTPPLQQFRDLWRAGFLTNPTSLLVAATSDLSMQALETAKDPVATAADMLMGAFTGQRTKGTLGPIRLAKAGYRGAVEGIKDAWRTFRGGRQLTTLQDEAAILRRPPTQVTVFKWRPLNALANAYMSTVFNSFEAKTAFFKAIAFRRSLIEQVELAARKEGLRGVQLRNRLAGVDANLKGDATAPPIPGFSQMAATAAHDAEVSTFQDKTLLGTIASSLTNVPSGESAVASIQSPGGRAIARGTLEAYRTAVTGVLPFTKTPGAIATRAIEYSPLGLARGGIEMIRTILKRDHADPALQRAAAEAIGRGTIGSFLVLLGYRLAQAGQLTPTVQGTTQQQKVARQGNAPGGALLVGPDWRRIGRIAPIGQILAIGSRLYEIAQNKGQRLGPGETLFQSAMGAGQSMTEMPFMQGVSNITEALKEQPSTTQPLGSKATRFATGYATGLIPAGVQAVHRGLHPEIVQPTNLKESLTLGGAPVVSPLTGPVKRTGGVAEALFDPFKRSADLRQTDPLVKALDEAGYAVPPLSREPGEDPHAFAQRQLQVIPTMRRMLTVAIGTPFYQQAARNEQIALSHARGLVGQPAFRGQTVVQIQHQYMRDHNLPSRADLLGRTAAMVNRFYGKPDLLRAELARLRAEREQGAEPVAAP
jgi:hypothetical protein